MTMNRKMKQTARKIAESKNITYLEALALAKIQYAQNNNKPEADREYMQEFIAELMRRNASLYKTNILGQEPLGKVVTFTSSKGGSGKTTMSLLVGSYIAQTSQKLAKQGIYDRPLKVVVVDMDTRDGQVGAFTAEITPTIVTYAVNEQSDLNDFVIHNKTLQIDTILAPRKLRTAEVATSNVYRNLVERLKDVYDYIILDSSVNYLDSLVTTSYELSDDVVFVTDIVSSTIGNFNRWYQDYKGLNDYAADNISKATVHLVFNKIYPGIIQELTNKSSQNSFKVSTISAMNLESKIFSELYPKFDLQAFAETPEIMDQFRMIAENITGLNFVSE